MEWSEVGGWLKNNAGTGAALVGSLLTGNIPGAVAAGVALVIGATGEAMPDKVLHSLQTDPATVIRLRELAIQDDENIRAHIRALTEAELKGLCSTAYGSFAHSAITPLVQLDGQHWLLELFHGPTLAFKDVALQLLGQLFERFLSGTDKKLTIVARHPETRDQPPSTPLPDAHKSKSSCCTRITASRTFSGGR